jgi:hypothetical protein
MKHLSICFLLIFLFIYINSSSVTNAIKSKIKSSNGFPMLGNICWVRALAYIKCTSDKHHHNHCIETTTKEINKKCPLVARFSLFRAIRIFNLVRLYSIAYTRAKADGQFKSKKQSKAYKQNLRTRAKNAFNKVFKGLVECSLTPYHLKDLIKQSIENIGKNNPVKMAKLMHGNLYQLSGQRRHLIYLRNLYTRVIYRLRFLINRARNNLRMVNMRLFGGRRRLRSSVARRRLLNKIARVYAKRMTKKFAKKVKSKGKRLSIKKLNKISKSMKKIAKKEVGVHKSIKPIKSIKKVEKNLDKMMKDLKKLSNKSQKSSKDQKSSKKNLESIPIKKIKRSPIRYIHTAPKSKIFQVRIIICNHVELAKRLVGFLKFSIDKN